MSKIWNQYLEDFGDIEGHEYEVEKRNDNPALYDCARAIGEYDDPDFLNDCIQQGMIDVNGLEPRTHKPLLFLALTSNRLESCKILMDNGADLSFKEMEKSYLWWAIFSNANKEIVEVLLRKSTNPDAPIAPLSTEELEDLMDIAERKSSKEVVDLLKSLK
jgi:hypothetical protein